MASGTLTRPKLPRTSPFDGYSRGERPIGSYAALTATFFGLSAGAALAARARGVKAPEKIAPLDLITVGLATHKLSRTIAKDKVTAWIRAPFTEFQGESGQGEVEEKTRGTGLRKAIGELLVCPYCLAQWVASGFVAGLVFAPRATRLVAAVYTAETVSDFLQLAYFAAEERA